jgi:hypothetical protein
VIAENERDHHSDGTRYRLLLNVRNLFMPFANRILMTHTDYPFPDRTVVVTNCGRYTCSEIDVLP